MNTGIACREAYRTRRCSMR